MGPDQLVVLLTTLICAVVLGNPLVGRQSQPNFSGIRPEDIGGITISGTSDQSTISELLDSLSHSPGGSATIIGNDLPQESPGQILPPMSNVPFVQSSLCLPNVQAFQRPVVIYVPFPFPFPNMVRGGSEAPATNPSSNHVLIPEPELTRKTHGIERGSHAKNKNVTEEEPPAPKMAKQEVANAKNEDNRDKAEQTGEKQAPKHDNTTQKADITKVVPEKPSGSQGQNSTVESYETHE